MPYGQINADQISTSVQGYSLGAGNSSLLKNKIINGGMVIDQRNAGASVTPSNSYTLDRWSTNTSQASKFTVQQNAGSVTTPVGFANYLGVTSSSAYSVGAGDVFTIYQNIEGFNTSDLNFGTANAQTVTLSFWVRSSLTGTFGGALVNSAETRSYPFSYTISSANTWEQKTITIAGDTSGTWIGATNGIGIRVRLGLGAGSTYSGTAGSWQAGNFFTATGATSVVGTNGATFYITGVQLEVGSSATGFEYRQYTTELQLCQRYCQVYTAETIGLILNAYYPTNNVWLKTTMRATPTLANGSFPSGGGTAAISGGGASGNVVSIYNSAGSWGSIGSAVITFTGTLSSEL